MYFVYENLYTSVNYVMLKHFVLEQKTFCVEGFTCWYIIFFMVSTRIPNYTLHIVRKVYHVGT